MAVEQKWQSVGNAPTVAVEPATPPLRPAPMPRQILDYWTPSALVTTMLARLRERPPALQHATVSVNVPVNADEPR